MSAFDRLEDEVLPQVCERQLRKDEARGVFSCAGTPSPTLAADR